MCPVLPGRRPGRPVGGQLSAAASGLIGLARATTALLRSGELTQTILETTEGYFFVTSVSLGATVAVHTVRQCDLGLVGYEMTVLAERVGQALDPGVRTATTAGGMR